MTISGRVHNNKWIRKGRKMWRWNGSSVILSCLINITYIKSYILSMPFILTVFKWTKIKISMWKLWTQICPHSLITSVMVAYADMVGELMFIENCLIVNIMKLKTPLCFHFYIILSTSSISLFIFTVFHYTNTFVFVFCTPIDVHLCTYMTYIFLMHHAIYNDHEIFCWLKNYLKCFEPS